MCATYTLTLRTPLHQAAETGNKNECQLLIRARAETEIQDHREDTPLRAAVRVCQLDCVEKLIDLRCNLHAVDGQGGTALHMATTLERLRCLDLLVAEGIGRYR